MTVQDETAIDTPDHGDEKTQHRKDCEHRAWEIIHDATIPIEWKDGGFHMDFKELAKDIADEIESVEGERDFFKVNYEEAMRLLGIPAHKMIEQADAEPVVDRDEYWWVRHEGDVVMGVVRFRDGAAKEVAFFGTDFFAKADQVELLARVSPLPGPIHPVYDGPEHVARALREEVAGRTFTGWQSDYALGQTEACDHVLKAFEEAGKAGGGMGHAAAVAKVLDLFNRCAAGMMGEGYDAGYRNACRTITHRLGELAENQPAAAE